MAEVLGIYAAPEGSYHDYAYWLFAINSVFLFLIAFYIVLLKLLFTPIC